MKKERLIRKIKKETEIFFVKTGFPAEVRIETDAELSFLISVKIEDPQVLIGKKGETLVMIQRLLSKVFKKGIDKEIRIDLDINDYKKRYFETLEEFVQGLKNEES